MLTDHCDCILSEDQYFIPVHAEANQDKIVEAGGLSSLLMLLKSSEDETIRRIAAGAIANLAMNGNYFLFLHYFKPQEPFMWFQVSMRKSVLSGWS